MEETDIYTTLVLTAIHDKNQTATKKSNNCGHTGATSRLKTNNFPLFCVHK